MDSNRYDIITDISATCEKITRILREMNDENENKNELIYDVSENIYAKYAVFDDDDYDVVIDMENGNITYERCNSDGSISSISTIDSAELRQLVPPYQPEPEVCVLCGHTRETHSVKHKFIKCKEWNRCITCNLFFYQHSHVQSCYHPRVPVQMEDS